MSYVAPDCLEAAFAAMAARDGACLLSGGTDVYPALGDRPPPAALIDLSRIAELQGIAVQPDGGWRIGAAVTWRALLRTPLPSVFDGLKAAAREIGSVQIQSAGTLAGNLCNASPAADGVPALLALDAEVELASRTGSRRLALGDFITGVRKTALRPGEVMSAIHVPPQPEGACASFAKLGARRYMVISVVMVAAVIHCADGRIATARVVVGAASPVALRLGALESELVGRAVATLAGPVTEPRHLTGLSPIDDIRGDAAYRAGAVATLCDRAIREAAVG